MCHFHHFRLGLARPSKVATMDCYCAGERYPQIAPERQVFLITSKGLTLFYVGFYIRFDPPVRGTPVTAPGYIALIAIYIFAAVYQFGWGPVVWTYCSVCPPSLLCSQTNKFTGRLRQRPVNKEIPPARLRPLNMGMATASQWLFNFIVAKCTPLMFATLGAHGYGTYFLYGAFCFTMVIYAWYCVPETKGQRSHQVPDGLCWF